MQLLLPNKFKAIYPFPRMKIHIHSLSVVSNGKTKLLFLKGTTD